MTWSQDEEAALLRELAKLTRDAGHAHAIWQARLLAIHDRFSDCTGVLKRLLVDFEFGAVNDGNLSGGYLLWSKTLIRCGEASSVEQLLRSVVERGPRTCSRLLLLEYAWATTIRCAAQSRASLLSEHIVSSLLAAAVSADYVTPYDRLRIAIVETHYRWSGGGSMELRAGAVTTMAECVALSGDPRVIRGMDPPIPTEVVNWLSQVASGRL